MLPLLQSPACTAKIKRHKFSTGLHGELTKPDLKNGSEMLQESSKREQLHAWNIVITIISSSTKPGIILTIPSFAATW